MPRVRGRLVPPLVPRTDAILAHETLDALLAGRKAAFPHLTYHPWRAIRTLDLILDQGEQLRVRQALPIGMTYPSTIGGLSQERVGWLKMAQPLLTSWQA